MAPSGRPSRIIGTANTLRYPVDRASWRTDSATWEFCRMSRTWTSSYVLCASESDVKKVRSIVNILRLDHAALLVKDIERSRQFYCQVLGMEAIPGLGAIWLAKGSAEIHLLGESIEGRAA